MLRTTLLLLAALVAVPPVHAQSVAPSNAQSTSMIAIQQERVDLLREEVKELDARIESRLDSIVETLESIADSKDSRTKVARMKEDTGKRLMKTIGYYDQKRAALKEELRNPRLHLTNEEKRTLVAVFDAKIEKRVHQVLELNKSMPTHEDHERYKVSHGGDRWDDNDYERNVEFEQNRRMTSHSNTQRDAIVKQLDASIARLDRQSRALKTQIAATTDPSRRTALNDELAKTDALIAERRKQRLETLKPSGTAMHTVALKEAMDLDKALQTAIADLSRDFTTLFQRYHTLLNELSSLHAAEAALPAGNPG